MGNILLGSLLGTNFQGAPADATFEIHLLMPALPLCHLLPSIFDELVSWVLFEWPFWGASFGSRGGGMGWAGVEVVLNILRRLYKIMPHRAL